MRVWSAFAFATLAAHGVAHASVLQYCEPLRAYYPEVSACPAPWRPIEPALARQPVAIPPGPGYAPRWQPAAAAVEQPDADAPPQSNADTPPQPPRAPAREATTTAPASNPVPDAGEGALAPHRFGARGDELDPWCKSAKTPLNIAMCSDDDLRALALQRLHAFDHARSRLGWDQQKALAADQNGWAMSSPQTCGLNSNAAPTLPLSSHMKDCLLRTGRERLAYLETYGSKPADGSQPSASADKAAPEQPAADAAKPAAETAPATPAHPTPQSQLINAAQAPSTSTSPAGRQAPAAEIANNQLPMTPGASPAPPKPAATATPPAPTKPAADATPPAPPKPAADATPPAPPPAAADKPQQPAKPAPVVPASSEHQSSGSGMARLTAIGAGLMGLLTVALWVLAAIRRRRNFSRQPPGEAIPTRTPPVYTLQPTHIDATATFAATAASFSRANPAFDQPAVEPADDRSGAVSDAKRPSRVRAAPQTGSRIRGTGKSRPPASLNT